MRKEYNEPTINISKFSAENIVTDSGITAAYQDIMGNENAAAVQKVDFASIMEFNN